MMEFNSVLTEELYLASLKKGNPPLDMSNADLSLMFLTEGHFPRANFSGAKMYGTKLVGANLIASHFVSSQLLSTNFTEADLSRANLSFAVGVGTNFSHANLSVVKANNAQFTWSDFFNANLTAADFSGADLTGSSFEGANLSCAKLYCTNLIDANLEGTNLTFLKEGNGKEIVTLYIAPFQVVICYPTQEMAIGCKQYSFERWFDWWQGFSDKEIDKMSFQASDWWRANKDALKVLCKKGWKI